MPVMTRSKTGEPSPQQVRFSHEALIMDKLSNIAQTLHGQREELKRMIQDRDYNIRTCAQAQSVQSRKIQYLEVKISSLERRMRILETNNEPKGNPGRAPRTTDKGRFGGEQPAGSPRANVADMDMVQVQFIPLGNGIFQCPGCENAYRTSYIGQHMRKHCSYFKGRSGRGPAAPEDVTEDIRPQ